MTHDDYQATGINDFDNLINLLETRRKMIGELCNIVDLSHHKVTAYGALKAARVRFDEAVLDELQKILESHKAVGLLEKSQDNTPTKPKMTDEQKELNKSFHNSLFALEAHIADYLRNHGKDNYTDMLNNVRELGFKVIADYKKQFAD